MDVERVLAVRTRQGDEWQGADGVSAFLGAGLSVSGFASADVLGLAAYGAGEVDAGLAGSAFLGVAAGAWVWVFEVCSEPVTFERPASLLAGIAGMADRSQIGEAVPTSLGDGLDVVLFGRLGDAALPASSAPHAESSRAFFLGEGDHLAALGSLVDVSALTESVLAPLILVAGAVLALVAQAAAVLSLLVEGVGGEDPLASSADGTLLTGLITFPF